MPHQAGSSRRGKRSKAPDSKAQRVGIKGSKRGETITTFCELIDPSMSWGLANVSGPLFAIPEPRHGPPFHPRSPPGLWLQAPADHSATLRRAAKDTTSPTLAAFTASERSSTSAGPWIVALACRTPSVLGMIRKPETGPQSRQRRHPSMNPVVLPRRRCSFNYACNGLQLQKTSFVAVG